MNRFTSFTEPIYRRPLAYESVRVNRGQQHTAQIQPLTFSIQAAAAYLGVPPETLRSWTKRGLFRRVRIGQRTLILKQEIDEYVRRQLEAEE